MVDKDSTVAGTGAGRLHYAYNIVLLGLFTILGAQGFLRFGYAMILPNMRDAMGLTYTQTGMLATANYVGYTLGALGIGPLVTRFGSRRTIAVATLITGLAVVLTGAATNYEMALVLQLIAGAGAVTALSPVMSLATAWFAPGLRGRAAGVMSAGGPLGSLVTGPLVPALIAVFGLAAWRVGWFVLGGAIVLAAVMNFFFLRDRPADVGLLPLGATKAVESVKAVPDLRRAYTTPVVWYIAGLALLSTLQAISFNTFFTIYLVQERGVDNAAAGALWAFAGLVGIISGFAWGAVSDRLGRKHALLAVYLVQGACFALFAIGGSLPVYAVCAFLYGFTARANFTIMAAFCGDLLGPRLAAAAFSINNLFAGAGLAMGPALAGMIADRTSSFTLAFWGSAVVAVVGALGASLLRNRPVDQP
ncbi:MAG: MFS transporter [Chloroflexota bacterium]